MELADFVEFVMPTTARVLTTSPTTGVLTFSLYDAFTFAASVDERTCVFGLALLLPGDASLTRLLGLKLAENNDPESVRQSLMRADEYCHLRLPDKFLEAYEN